jgi:hypothetical protein
MIIVLSEEAKTGILRSQDPTYSYEKDVSETSSILHYNVSFLPALSA